MAVKELSNRVVTKKADNNGRSVKLTKANIGPVCVWLGDALISWEGGLTKPLKIKLKTPKGPRVAGLDDVIVKYGTRRNGGKVTFEVHKAS